MNPNMAPGPGDPVTWPPYSGHPNDPRAPLDDDFEEVGPEARCRFDGRPAVYDEESGEPSTLCADCMAEEMRMRAGEDRAEALAWEWY